MKRMKFKFTKKRIILTSIIGVILIILIAVGVYATYLFMQFKHVEIDKSSEALGIENAKPQDDKITNIALYGIDDDGNSDSIMIISIDGINNKIKMISMLRDSLVEIEPDNKKPYYTKLNEAYDYGPQVAIKTLNKNFHLDIDDYAAIKFAGMAKIIDSVDGIDLEVTKAEADMINGLINSTKELSGPMLNSHGNVHLNGNQAVAYSRIRKVNTQDGDYGDFGRTDRQRAVMEKLFYKAINISYSQYPSLINTALPFMETSMDVNRILSLAGILKNNDIVFEQTKIPDLEYTIDDDFYYNEKSTVYYNLEYASNLINAFIFEDIKPKDYITNNQPPTQGFLNNK